MLKTGGVAVFAGMTVTQPVGSRTSLEVTYFQDIDYDSVTW